MWPITHNAAARLTVAPLRSHSVPMEPADSVDAFETFAAAHGVSLVGITPHDGIAQMLAFYEAIAADGCAADSGDMLLFQWGTFDWGEGEHFEVNITRQFIECANEEDAVSQLQLIFSFPLSTQFAALSEGHRWCEAPGRLEAFRAFVLSSPALAAVADQAAPGVALRHSYV